MSRDPDFDTIEPLGKAPDKEMAYDSSSESPPKKGLGCFFWGCMTLIALFLLFILVVAIAVWSLYRYAVNTTKEYTETVARPVTSVDMPEEERKALHERVDAFRDAVNAEKPTAPIILSSDDINALIDDNPSLKGKVHVDIVGDKIQAEVSIRIDDWSFVKNFKELQGRYFNGKATIQVSLQNNKLDLRAEGVEVNGKPLPPNIKNELEGKNLIQDDSIKDPDALRAIAKFASIEVKDGKMIITPRVSAKDDPGKSDKDSGSEPKLEKDKDPGAEPKLEAEPKSKDDAMPQEKSKPELHALIDSSLILSPIHSEWRMADG